MLPAVPVKRISLSKSTRVILIILLWQTKLLSRTAGQNWSLVGDRRDQLLSLIHYPHNNGSARLATRNLQTPAPCTGNIHNGWILVRRGNDYRAGSWINCLAKSLSRI